MKIENESTHLSAEPASNPVVQPASNPVEQPVSNPVEGQQSDKAHPEPGTENSVPLVWDPETDRMQIDL